MQITREVLLKLQKRLKVGNRRGVHLNAIPGRSRYKLDITRLSILDERLPDEFIHRLLSEPNMSFDITWTGNVTSQDTQDEDLQRALVKLSNSLDNLVFQEQAIQAEKGVKTFGFGYPIVARRSESDGKLTVAPILIWALDIKPTHERNTWRVSRTIEDPIYVNEVLINHLEDDVKVQIPPIKDELLEDGLIDKLELAGICADIINALDNTKKSERVHKYRKAIDQVRPIPDKARFEKAKNLAHGDARIHFGGLFSLFEMQKQGIISDYDHLLSLDMQDLDILGEHESPFQPFSSVRVDPSQQAILSAMGTTRNLVIQGPPGTGKSQSLTAILINAMENRKKTLVVCEKHAALNVLNEALKERNLDSHAIMLTDISRDRKRAVDSVRDRLEQHVGRDYAFAKAEEVLRQTQSATQSQVEQINAQRRLLGRQILGTDTWTDSVGRKLKAGRNTQSDAPDVDNLKFEYNNKELSHWQERLRNSERRSSNYAPPRNSDPIQLAHVAQLDAYDAEKKLKAFIAALRPLVATLDQAEQQLASAYKAHLQQATQDEIETVTPKLQRIRTVRDRYTRKDDFLQTEKTSKWWYKLVALLGGEKKRILNDQREVYQLLQEVQAVTTPSKLLDGRDITSTSLEEACRDIRKVLKQVQETEASLKDAVDTHYADLDLLTMQSAAHRELLSQYRDAHDNLAQHTQEPFLRPAPDLTDHVNLARGIQAQLDAYDQLYVNQDGFFPSFEWQADLATYKPEEQTMLQNLAGITNWDNAFTDAYLDSMLRHHATGDLPRSDENLQELDKKFDSIKQQQLQYVHNLWSSTQKTSSRKRDKEHPGKLTRNIYNKRRSKSHSRLSLREIVHLDWDLFTDFFPVVLTTPDVASSLFREHNFSFDIVLSDEASQLRLEDNLPALLKGKQIIIAGDEHQMPPSDYFSKMLDGDDAVDDEDDDLTETERIQIKLRNSALDCESLLEFALHSNFDKRYLDFHYRSRHPYLIQFSNQAFYNNRLQPLPSTLDYRPIGFHQVNGTYSDNTNLTEARKVLYLIDTLIIRKPDGSYPSVGVATFNVKQRNLILSLIKDLMASDEQPELRSKMQELVNHNFFVKNLENIQGDERDIIILSTTYGPDADNKFAQRFGSINRQKGYKLLNVIVTRAKLQLHVVTSIPPEYYLNYASKLEEEQANNRVAVFYAYLAYARAVSEGDDTARKDVLAALASNAKPVISPFALDGDLESPFEEEVHAALTDHIDIARLLVQHEHAGYRIDMVYLPANEHAAPIAIECDGAGYHSSEEAYLHDLHRQKILEQQGFIFYRIWSTNWWRNPEQETLKLAAFLKKHENTAHPQVKRDLAQLGIRDVDQRI